MYRCTDALAFIGFMFSQIICHPQCKIKSSDFAEILETPCFVDKTLMIKDVLDEPKFKYITSPRRFGKTTNLDMIRRFIQLNTDGEGNPLNVRKSANYKIFRNKSLRIYEHSAIYKKHFGKYPVVYIDYGPLLNIGSYENMLEQFRIVLLNTFEPHTYLIENPELWDEEDTKEQFIKYIHPTWHLKIKSAAIRYGFPFLIKMLYKHFKKPVYILVDNFDAYVESLVFKKVPDIDIIYTYLQSINNNLLSKSDAVHSALLVGTLQILYKPGVNNYHFLGNHPFSDYFGFTNEDVCVMVANVLHDSNQTYTKLTELEKYYNGYRVRSKNTRMYSQWSLLNYICNGVVFNCFRSSYEFFQSFRLVLNIPDISKPLLKIIMGSPFPMNVTHVFSSDDIFAINDLVTKCKVKNTTIRLLYFNYLYQLGYFTNGGFNDDRGLCFIPNTEILNEFKGLLDKFSNK